MTLRRLVKPLIPRRLLALRSRLQSARLDAQFATQSPAAVFRTIYKQRLWGSDGSADFYSGPGSHDKQVVEPYIQAVARFLESMATKPDVVDLGCGDFNIGSQLRPFCRRYTACDIVEELVQRNRRIFASLDVEFSAIDAANDPLPDGDVIFVRQVLQHMSNAQIHEVIRKLSAYRWAVITEHLPDNDNFKTNIDKPPGPTTRLQFDSGVAVEQPPFALAFEERRVLCEVRYEPGRIETVSYRLRA